MGFLDTFKPGHSDLATALQWTYNNLFQILMKLKCIWKGILTPLFCYKEMSLNHEAWKCFKPTKKSWWLSLSFDWFTCWNQYVITEPFHYQPPFFNKSMKNLKYFLIDVSFLNPRGMIFCHSLIPRFLEEWDSPRICHPYYIDSESIKPLYVSPSGLKREW